MVNSRSCVTFLLLLLLIGCGQSEPAPPTAVSTGSVPAVSQTTPTATVLPTITAVPPTATFTPTPTATPRPTITPAPEPAGLVDKGAYILVDDWSVDGQWLAYWLATRDDVENMQPYTSPGGRLHVVNPSTGESCVFPHFHAAAAGQFSLEWQPDNNLIVHDHETQQRWRVQPCQPGTFPLPHQPPPGRTVEDGSAPDGRFRVTTELQAEGDNILTFLTILSHQDGAEITAVTWQTYEAKGEWGLGGEWVTPTQFFIRRSLAGPLLLDAERPGTVTDVLRDLFGQTELREDITVNAAPGTDPNTFYLLLHDWGAQENVQLFHASTGLVETLPFYETWSPPFTADSAWLLLRGEMNALQVRRVANVDDEWLLLGEGVQFTLWNEAVTELAFSQTDRLFRRETFLTWQTFPDGEVIGQWSTAPFGVRPVGWSPDGRFLTAIGVGRGSFDQALLIFDRHWETENNRRSGRLPSWVLR
jgi:hypothetical protein